MFNIVSWAIWLNSPKALSWALWIQNPNKLDLNGVAPIHYLAQKGDIEAMQVLLDNKADINMRDKDGNNVVHYLVKGGMTNEVTNAFVDAKGADLNAVNNMGQTPLMLAVKQGESWYVAKDCKIVFQNDVNVQDIDGKTVVHYVVEANNNSDKSFWMDGLIGFGANVNILDNDGLAAIHYAAKKGDKTSVELLAKSYFNHCKADAKTIVGKMAEFFNIKDSFGKTALHHAVENKAFTVFDYLASKKSFVKFDIVDNQKQNIVHIAAKVGDLDLLKKVIAVDVNLINKLDAAGNLPLHIAVENKKSGVANIILTENKAAFINFPNKEKDTALHIACKKGDEYSVKVLLKHGANANVFDANGKTPLIIAVENGKTSIVKELLDAKTDLSFKDADGNTSLMIACKNHDSKIVRKLLEAGANANDTNKLGLRAFDLVKNSDDIKADLIKFGGVADVRLSKPNISSYNDGLKGNFEVGYDNDGLPTIEFHPEQQSYLSWIGSWFN